MSENEDTIFEADAEELNEEEDSDLIISFFSADKWGKKQTITFLDFSSLDGTISSIFKILAVALLVLLFKKGSDE